jgi:hypothetical protein
VTPSAPPLCRNRRLLPAGLLVSLVGIPHPTRLYPTEAGRRGLMMFRLVNVGTCQGLFLD